MLAFTIETQKGKRQIGPGFPTFIIAEMSGNHCQKLSRAIEIIDAAADAGVDAIKLQTYTPDTLTIDCNNEYFIIKDHPAWAGKTLYQLYASAYTPWEWHPELKTYAEKKGLILFSTPFDETAVDFLEKLEMPLYKAASFMTENLYLLDKIGRTGKPVIMSRGLTNQEQLKLAIDTLKNAGSSQIAILHCISSYPAAPSEMNLRTIPDISNHFHLPVGLSDHTLSPSVPIAAISLGACIIEKHLTISRKAGGPDAEFSLEPHEMKQLVHNIREAEAALGHISYEASAKEKTGIIFKQSIFVVRDIKKGEPLNKENVRIIRPGYGLEPRHFTKVLEKKAKRDLKRGTPLTWDDVENG